MNSIQQWLLGGKEWAVGVALYNTYGDNELFKQALKQGESPYRKERLVKHLQELSKKAPQQETVKPVHEPQVKKVVVGKAVLQENKVEAEKDPYREEWLPIYKEMMNLHARLEDMTPDERGEAAHEILRLERRMMYIWWKRDYYLKYGEKVNEETPTVNITDMNALRLKLQNVRTYRCKVEKELVINPKNERLLARLERYKKEIADFEKRLGNE